MNYAFDMGDLDPDLADTGSWAISLNATYLNTYKTDPGIPGTNPIVGSGTVGLEHWKGLLRTTYTTGPLAVTTTVRFRGPAVVDTTLANQDNPANHVPAFYYIDLNASYDVTDWASVYVGANNLFDTRPPEIYPGALDTTGTGTNADVYDPIGQYLYAGVNFKL